MNRRIVTNVLCSLVMLACSSLAVGQVNREPPTPQLVKCSISVASSKIALNEPPSVSITLENVSGRDVDVEAAGSFKLLKNDPVAIARDFTVSRDSYWGPLDLSTGEPLRLVANPAMLRKGILEGRVPKAPLHLSKGEVKSLKVELARLLWNYSGLNDWPHEKFSDIVERGPYWLVLNCGTKDVVQSNRIEITIE